LGPRRAAVVAKVIKVYRSFAARAFKSKRIALLTFHKEYRFNQSSACLELPVLFH